MKILDYIRDHFRHWLKIDTGIHGTFDIDRLFNYSQNCVKNLIWYNGDSYELSQFYAQTPDTTGAFWNATMSAGNEIRKMHSGLPRLIVNTLTNITAYDINEIVFMNEADKIIWEEIARENNFKTLIKNATKDVLKYGDGAFKISYDESLSPFPIIEFVSGDKVEYTYNRGRISEIKFYTRYNEHKVEYMLEETYGYGYIKYKLFNESGEEVDKSIIEDIANLQDIYFDNSIMFAVQYKIFDSDMYKGRGASIYDGKIDMFDALDECISQWNDAVRMGRVKTYIPDTLIPRDIETGSLLKPNKFDNRFVKVGHQMSEGANDEITTIQPDIKIDAYVQTYLTCLSLALQGILSPTTLGIDTKKVDNAEAEREKEKTTLYTRQIIIDELTRALSLLICNCIYAYDVQYGIEFVRPEFNLSFGEYSNPSFDSVIKLLSDPNTPMSLEAKVEELWSDTKTDEWKQNEIERIRRERAEANTFYNHGANETIDNSQSTDI